MVDYQDFVYCGPSGCLILNALVDSGSTYSVITASVAERLGLSSSGEQLVDTNGGMVVWHRARASVGLPNQPVVAVEVWVAPDDPPVRVSLGWNALVALGFQLVPPDPVNADQAHAEGVPIPDADYADGVSAAAGPEGPSMAQSRLAVCRSCSYVQDLPLVGPRCTVCGCLMGVKARIPGAQCPMGRW